MVVVQPFTDVTSAKLFTVVPLQASVAVGAVKLGVAVHSIVALAPAAPIVGGVVSTIEITCDTLAEWLPQASTASQLLVMVVVQPLTEVTSPKLFTVVPLQASVAVGAVKLGVAVHSIVALAPAAPIVGGVVSTIEITCDTVAEWLPQASTASQLLVIVVVQPLTEVTSPKLFTVVPLHASVAVGAVKLGVAVHSIVALAPAAPIVGGVVSTIEITCDTVAEWLPQASTASQLLVMVVVQPLTDVTSLKLFTVVPLQASVAVGAVKLGVAVHSIVALAPAAPIVGGVVSTIEITCDTVAEWLPQASTASQLLVMVVVQPLTDVTSLKLFTVVPLQASVAVGAVKLGVAVHSIVALAPAAPIVGGVVSTIEITCDTVAEWLPQASTASQLLVMVVVQPLTDVTSPKLFTVVPLQASVAVGAVKLGVAVHSIVALAPAEPIVGGVVSTIEITCDTVAE